MACRTDVTANARMPVLSVIVPTFRRLNDLTACLRTLSPSFQLISQEKFEVIVGDDEQSTETRDLVLAILPSAIYVEGPKRGPAANRNHAATKARGAWLVFTDDDCIPGRGWLKGYESAIREHYHAYEGKTTCKDGLQSPLQVSPVNETGGYLWSCNMMISAALFRGIGGFDDHFPFPAMEDVDLRERLRDAGIPFQFVPSATVDHPPRKIKRLAELTMQHKSYIYFSIVKRNEIPRLGDALLFTLKHRIRACLRPNLKDLPWALRLYVSECIALCLRYHAWKRHTVRRALL